MKVSGRKVQWRRLVAHTGLLTLASAILSLPATAAAGGQALPWEQPLTRLQQSLSGPVAGAIARRAVYAVCAIAFIISAAALLGGLFAVGAAVV